MREGPYRDGSQRAPRVYRASYRHLLRYGVLTLLCSLFTFVIGYRNYREGLSWEGIGIFAMVSLATLILAWATVQATRTRLVIDDLQIASVTPTKTVTFSWDQVARVQRIAVNNDVAFLLHGLEGGQIHVGDGLADFEGAKAELRLHLGPLPGD